MLGLPLDNLLKLPPLVLVMLLGLILGFPVIIDREKLLKRSIPIILQCLLVTLEDTIAEDTEATEGFMVDVITGDTNAF